MHRCIKRRWWHATQLNIYWQVKMVTLNNNGLSKLYVYYIYKALWTLSKVLLTNLLLKSWFRNDYQIAGLFSSLRFLQWQCNTLLICDCLCCNTQRTLALTLAVPLQRLANFCCAHAYWPSHSSNCFYRVCLCICANRPQECTDRTSGSAPSLLQHWKVAIESYSKWNRNKSIGYGVTTHNGLK